MELKLLSQFENPLLQRKEIKVVAIFEAATPSREEIKTEVCKKFNLPEETTVIRKVFQEKGIKRAICLLNVYNSKEAMLQIESKYLLERKKKKKEKAEEKAEEKKEEAKEEAKEAKEEKKEEEKTGEING
jgi:small subunit ribosomal protein S24e